MPEKRFQIGDYWLGRVAGSESWYAFHYDPGSRHIKRETLRTPVGTDEAQARLKLAEFAALKAKIVNVAPQQAGIDEVLFRYINLRSDSLPSADLGRAASDHLAWFGSRNVSELTPALQREFIRHLAEKKGHSTATIRRYLAVLSAALGRAMREGELAGAPQVILAESQIAEAINAGTTTALAAVKPRRLSIEEMARFFDAIKSSHMWRYSMTGINTLARPDAITELTRFQIDDSGVIDLNPAGRVQTKKYRPIVPMTETLAEWLRLWRDDCSHVVHYKGRPIDNPKKAFHDTAVAAGLIGEREGKNPARAVTPYTLRRTMARLLRAERVPMADIAAMLGHSIKGMGTTEIYADADPTFLATVKAGIERIIDKVEACTKVAPMRAQGLVCTQIAPKDIKARRIYVGRNGRSP